MLLAHCRYSLCYGKDVGRFLGMPQTFYMFKDTYGQAATHIGASTIPSSIAAMYELGFALVAPAIVACSLSGMTSFENYLQLKRPSHAHISVIIFLL